MKFPKIPRSLVTGEIVHDGEHLLVVRSGGVLIVTDEEYAAESALAERNDIATLRKDVDQLALACCYREWGKDTKNFSAIQDILTRSGL